MRPREGRGVVTRSGRGRRRCGPGARLPAAQSGDDGGAHEEDDDDDTGRGAFGDLARGWEAVDLDDEWVTRVQAHVWDEVEANHRAFAARESAVWVLEASADAQVIRVAEEASGVRQREDVEEQNRYSEMIAAPTKRLAMPDAARSGTWLGAGRRSTRQELRDTVEPA